ncbi:MAG: sigma-70 family RNA polymerase sigma factor [Acidobacteriota bacterium]
MSEDVGIEGDMPEHEPGSAWPDAFVRACDEAEVPEPTRVHLWRVLTNSGRDPEDPERLDQLVEDYRHFALYRASREGDQQAARQFDEYWRKAAGSFFGARFSQSEVEDLTAVFFERVYRLIGTDFAWPCPFSAYLRSLLLNMARDHVGRLVKSRQRESALDDQVGIEPVDEAPSAERIAISRQRMDSVREALLELSASDREILLACLVEERPAAEVAEEMGLKRDAVYQRLHRARARLAAHLKGVV